MCVLCGFGFFWPLRVRLLSVTFLKKSRKKVVFVKIVGLGRYRQTLRRLDGSKNIIGEKQKTPSPYSIASRAVRCRELSAIEARIPTSLATANSQPNL